VDERGERQLVGYVVMREGTPGVGVGELREHLRRSLPEYMVPGQLMVLERLPLTASGKVDRERLPEPRALESSQTSYIAPRTALEQTLAGIWAGVLGLTQVGVRENFFDTGGDSIRMISVLEKLNVEFPGKLTMVDLFAYSTIEQLAEVLSARA
jgi:aryl carrier-like protein